MLGGVILIAAASEAKAVYRLFFNPGTVGRGSFDYFTLLLIPIPALMAIMSRGETKKWTAAGNINPAIASLIDWRINFLAVFFYIIVMTMKETLH